MSMHDTSYCSTKCSQKDCERNLEFNHPTEKIYTVSYLDCDNPDCTHKDCKWKIINKER